MQTTAGVQTIDYYTAELRFSGRAWDRVDWTVGAFYYDGESVNNQIVSIPFLGFVANVPPFPFDDPSKVFVNTDNVHENNNESVFAHAVWDITEKLALTAGVRYSSDEKVVSFDNTRVQNPHVVVEGNNTDYKLGLDYQFTPDILAYASVATGYRPGSYNPRPFQATQVVAVEAEDSEAYELGFKSDWFDHRLRTNVAVFYTDWKTRITPVGGTECLLLDLGPPPVYQADDPTTPGSVTDDLGNVCETTTSRTYYENTPGEIQGIEVEATWEPIDGLVLSGVYGWIDWESPDINDDPTVTSELPPYVPEDNWAFSMSYGMALDGGASLTPRVDLYGQAEICSQNVFVDSTFPGASCTDAYELVNVRLEWRSSGNTWTVAVGATNVTDEEYFYNKFDLTSFGQPHAEGQPAPPARVVRDPRPHFLRSQAIGRSCRGLTREGGPFSLAPGNECYALEAYPQRDGSTPGTNACSGRPLCDRARATRTAGRSAMRLSHCTSRGVCAAFTTSGARSRSGSTSAICVDVGDGIIGPGEPHVLRERRFEAADGHREAQVAARPRHGCRR